ncbi:MAG: conjugative transposon protein TraM [Bacteroidota bacterium]
MQQTQTNKRKKQIVFISLILLVFGALAYFGYRNFVKPKEKPVPVTNGLNSKLPEAEKAKDLNKLELYMQAEKDSIAHAEQEANDPYMQHLLSEKRRLDSVPKNKVVRVAGTKRQETRERGAANTDKRIEEIYKLIDENPKSTDEPKNTKNVTIAPSGDKQVENLGPDPELKQLSEMLDKLKDLQNPALSETKTSLPFKKIDTLYKTLIVNPASPNQTIRAVIHNTQKVYSGSTVKLRLLTDVVIGAVTISRGSSIYGICSINNERVNIRLSMINYHNQAIPVSLTVLDMDGIEGVHIMGNMSGEAISEGTDRAINSFNLNSYSTSIASQVAGAGIQTGKSLLSKKVKLQTATLKASHYVLLQNSNAY